VESVSNTRLSPPLSSRDGSPALPAAQDPETRDAEPRSVARFRAIMGRDAKMRAVLDAVRTAARSTIPVLVLGPTGSGKELVARMVHELGPRAAARFQPVSAAALPDSLFESELFGYEKGAFTGAHERKAGKLELARGGTLFLDEIGDLSTSGQAKLLRVLEDHEIDRLGSMTSVHVDFRLVSATNQPLEDLVRGGRFREDLFYRVNGFSIRVPGLSERPEDIGPLADRFLVEFCEANDLPPDGKTLSRGARERLVRHTWPGNVRELESTVARAALTAEGRIITDADIVLVASCTATDDALRRLPTLADVERTHILHVLTLTGWNKKEAARLLGVSRGTLYRKIADFNLSPADRSRPVDHQAHSC
jgi:DNA-binding NtrC family response regulator